MMHSNEKKTIGYNGKYKKEEYIKKQRESHLGEKNGRWKGGISRTFWKNKYIPISKTLKQICCICNSKKKLVTHHIDFDFKNNSIENITIVCRSCHNKIHKIKPKEGSK